MRCPYLISLHLTCAPGCTMEHCRRAAADQAARAQARGVLEGQLALIEELREAEPGCVWGRKQQAHVMGLLAELEGAGARREEAVAALSELKALDPLRRGFFDHALSQVRRGAAMTV